MPGQRLAEAPGDHRPLATADDAAVCGGLVSRETAALEEAGSVASGAVDPGDAGPGASVASGWVGWTFDCVGSG